MMPIQELYEDSIEAAATNDICRESTQREGAVLHSQIPGAALAFKVRLPYNSRCQKEHGKHEIYSRPTFHTLDQVHLLDQSGRWRKGTSGVGRGQSCKKEFFGSNVEFKPPSRE